MGEAVNEAVVRRFYDELWNEWKLDIADEIVSAEVRFRGSLGAEVTGLPDLKRYVESVRTAFPDWHNRIDEILAVGDRIVTRMSWSGTHRGALGEIAPTGARVEYSGAAFFRLSGGAIDEVWVVGDTQELCERCAERPRREDRLDLDRHGHRAVIDQGHAHAGAEDALARAEALAEAVVERLGLLGWRGVDIAGPVALARVPVEGELAHAEDLPLPQRLVRPPLGVVEDAQRAHLVGEPVDLLDAVPPPHAEQHQHARPDLGDPLAPDLDRGLADPLDQRPHVPLRSTPARYCVRGHPKENKNGSHFDLIGRVLEPFQLPFVQRGLIEILILAVPAGLLGTWIVLRGLAFFSHAVGTATFPGLVLADGLGFAAPLGAFGAAVVFSLGSWLLGRREQEGRDSGIAIVLVGCLAGGVILASDVFGSGANIETLLFGSLLLVDGGDIALAAATAAVTLAVSLLLGHRWLAVGFDPGSAPALGADARLREVALLGLIALATTAALSVVGALLVAALFVVPALTARLFAERMLSWQLASISLVAAEGTIGLWLSVKTDAPPGATIAVVSGAVFALAACARALARVRRAPALAAALTAAVLCVSGCAGPGADGGQLEVVATTTQIGDFAREVGGEDVAVDQILQPNTDPHTYEPRPSDVVATAEAELVFASGDDLDEWIGQVVSDSGSDAQVVDLGKAVPEQLPGESSGAEASRYDPHWWHDPRNAEAAVREIERRLSVADPAHRHEFARNARSYLGELQALDASIARCMDSVPVSRRKLVTDHDAFGYFAERYGIDVVGAVIPSQTSQAQPSAKDLSALAGLIEREGVEAIFPESSLSPRVAETIAAQTGASAEYALYGDTLGPEDSDGATYLQMEAANADSMVRGFTGGRRGCAPSR